MQAFMKPNWRGTLPEVLNTGERHSRSVFNMQVPRGTKHYHWGEYAENYGCPDFFSRARRLRAASFEPAAAYGADASLHRRTTA